MKLNLGCGKSRFPGWVSVDQIDYGDNVVFDLDKLTNSGRKMPFENDSCSEFILSHVIEHLHDTLGLFDELHRIAKAGAICHVAVPFAFSDESIEDQTHVRQFTFNSFCFFSQPVYCNADYGYRGDWHCDKVTVFVSKRYEGKSNADLIDLCKTQRNIGINMTADLIAVKPARAQKVELVRVPRIEFQFV
jgi:hypothetical protein